MEDELNTNTNINNNNNNNNILSSNHDLLEMSSENLTNYFLNNHTTTWQQQQQQQQQHNDQSSDPFESALSSMVSSPVATAAPSSSNGGGGNGGAGEAVMIKELIGRLGTICDNSGGDVSPQSCIVTTNNNGNVNNKYTNSGSNSNYSTPLNSPPSGNFNLATLMTNYGNNYGGFPVHQPSLGSLNADPGFVERAAKFSCFGSLYPNYKINDDGLLSSGLEPGKLSRVNSGKKMGENNGDSREGSSVSEQNPGTDTGFKGSVAAQNDGSSRKRKSGVSKAKVKETSIAKDGKVEVENGESNAKRSKVEDEKKENGEQNAEEPNKEASKPEPLKDYIHVRARRGQATDSHSLAERVRREKISERMKFLQDLVPGCNKVTGKATVLDEIINYVQSLQRQVEFLSMKLSTVNPRMEFNMEALFSKDMLQSRGSTMQQAMYQVDQNSAQAFPYGYQTTQQMSLPSPNGAPNRNEHCFSGNPMNGTAIRRNPGIPLPLIDGFLDPMTQMSNLWEDDLQSIVQMGINQNQSQNVPAGSIPNAQMKVEL